MTGVVKLANQLGRLDGKERAKEMGTLVILTGAKSQSQGGAARPATSENPGKPYGLRSLETAKF